MVFEFTLEACVIYISDAKSVAMVFGTKFFDLPVSKLVHSTISCARDLKNRPDFRLILNRKEII